MVFATVSPRVPRQHMVERLLRYLRANPNRVISRKDLGQGVWGFELDPRSRVVDQTIANLRKKLRPPERIVTHQGAGYELQK